jgi:hypothetical protein
VAGKNTARRLHSLHTSRQSATLKSITIATHPEIFQHDRNRLEGGNEMIEELIALIGEDAFSKLSCVFGGGKLYIGATENMVQKLAIVVGGDAAQKMIQAYSGGWIDIPKHTAAKIALRDKRITQDYDTGVTLRQLAQKYELSERQICYVLKKPL